MFGKAPGTSAIPRPGQMKAHKSEQSADLGTLDLGTLDLGTPDLGKKWPTAHPTAIQSQSTIATSHSTPEASLGMEVLVSPPTTLFITARVESVHAHPWLVIPPSAAPHAILALQPQTPYISFHHPSPAASASLLS